MRGIDRLSNLSDTLTRKIDAEADSAADEMEAAATYVMDAVARFRMQTKSMRALADDMLAKLGQTSNSAVAQATDQAASVASAATAEAAGAAGTPETLPENKISG